MVHLGRAETQTPGVTGEPGNSNRVTDTIYIDDYLYIFSDYKEDFHALYQGYVLTEKTVGVFFVRTAAIRYSIGFFGVEPILAQRSGDIFE